MDLIDFSSFSNRSLLKFIYLFLPGLNFGILKKFINLVIDKRQSMASQGSSERISHY